MRVLQAALVLCVAAASLGCDRGIEDFDPAEEPALPNLDRIYPKGAERQPSPVMQGMMGAGPARRDAPPSEPAARPAAGQTAPGATITGTIEISPELQSSAPASAMLFIIARTQPVGPPLAVVRVPNPSFPHAFEMGQAQVMIPTLRFEGSITVTARLDSDGNAMTKLPGDLVGEVATPVAPGASGLKLVLDGKL
ncbi:MAG: hypothetical protein NZ808_08390 [Myxococcota bacterium]|nr:hypothetical protein [Myxococcota bacterium]